MTDTDKDFQDGEAGVPENGVFDGDATSGATPSGVAPGGSEALPQGDSQPPIDGGVMGAVPENASTETTGVTLDVDRDDGRHARRRPRRRAPARGEGALAAQELATSTPAG